MVRPRWIYVEGLVEAEGREKTVEGRKEEGGKGVKSQDKGLTGESLPKPQQLPRRIQSPSLTLRSERHFAPIAGAAMEGRAKNNSSSSFLCARGGKEGEWEAK